MGYRIQYGQNLIKESIRDIPSKRIPKYLLPTIAVVSILLILAYFIGMDKMRDFFYPGDTEITDAALTAFADDLKKGEGLKGAFADFCKEIIEGANVS